ncbi:MAG: acylpyruvase [Nitrospinaceae bacterium]|nr:MAG: acylpyruvase [Nitrospinaceae bacterium]
MSPVIQIAGQRVEPARVFCVGKNYRKHIQELDSEVPDQPVIFMKPVSSLVAPQEKIRLPTHGACLHHEVELVVLVGRVGKNISESDAPTHIAGLSVGVDLTLRDVQSSLKKKGLPWEMAKAFDQSAPLGSFVPLDDSMDLNNISFFCEVNGVRRQQGNSGQMIYSISNIIQFLSGIWELLPGDLIYTGTPSGVGPVGSGDTLRIAGEGMGDFSWEFL